MEKYLKNITSNKSYKTILKLSSIFKKDGLVFHSGKISKFWPFQLHNVLAATASQHQCCQAALHTAILRVSHKQGCNLRCKQWLIISTCRAINVGKYASKLHNFLMDILDGWNMDSVWRPGCRCTFHISAHLQLQHSF